jgi:hypothetical protein
MTEDLNYLFSRPSAFPIVMLAGVGVLTISVASTVCGWLIARRMIAGRPRAT